MENILFVCTGNTCRSCMAEGLFNHFISKYIEEVNLSINIISSSAGLYAFSGQPPSENAVLALKKLWNINISNHVAKLVTADYLKKHDLILTMTNGQKTELVQKWPSLEQKTYVLGELVEDYENIDILDPYGMDLNGYILCAYQIMSKVSKLIKTVTVFRRNP